MSSSISISVKDLSSVLGISTHLIYKIVNDNNYDVIIQGNRKNLPPETVRKIISSRGFKYGPTKVLNIFGMKGGIGKTSIATAIADGASRLGFKVLAVDLDMQGNLTASFNLKRKGQKVLAHVLKEGKDDNVGISDIILKSHDYLSVLPSSLENAAIEVILSKPLNYATFFRTIFAPILGQFDLVIMDCPPALNKVTVCASCMADINLIPINADADAFDGLLMSIAEIHRLSKEFEIDIDYQIFWNKYDAREKLSMLIMGEISKQQELLDNLIPQVIRTDTTFKNTKALGESIYKNRKSSAKDDCFGLLGEVLGINAWLNEKKSDKVTESEEVTV